MIIFVPLWIIILYILCWFVFAKFVLDNIFLILFGIVVVIIFLCLLFKHPKETLSTVLVLSIITLCISCINRSNAPVTISKATQICRVYDENNNIIDIPKGAIIARYTDESIRVSDGNYIGFLTKCSWYYQGITHSFTESVVWDKNQWYLEDIGKTKYSDFKNGDWIHILPAG